MQIKNSILKLLLPLIIFHIFESCTPIVIGTATIGGYKGSVDERSIRTIIDDSVIATNTKTKLISDSLIKARYIDIDVLNGIVYIIGVVESVSQKRMAGDIARGIEGVKKVENQLIIGTTNIKQIIDNMILTSKIKTRFIKEPDIRATNVDIDTNNNIISLTGIIRSYQEREKIIFITESMSEGRRIKNNLLLKGSNL